MKIALQGTWALLAASALICLCVYVWSAYRGNDSTILSTDERLMSFKKKVFFSFAAIGLFTCVFQGIESMLWWLPSSWGTHDEEGDFTTWRVQLSALITLFLGGGLAIFVERAVREGPAFARASIERDELGKILDAFESPSSLKLLAAQYAKNIATAEADLKARGEQMRSVITYALPEGKRLAVYERLEAVVAKRLTAIEKRSSP
jgi:hypothetical protein